MGRMCFLKHSNKRNAPPLSSSSPALLFLHSDYAFFGAAGTFGTKTRSFCIITMQA
jgi:hypothetical protein